MLGFIAEYKKRFLPHLIAFRRYILAVLNKNVVVVHRSLKAHSFSFLSVIILQGLMQLFFSFRGLCLHEA